MGHGQSADNVFVFFTDYREKSIVIATHGYFLRTVIAWVLFGDLLSVETIMLILVNMLVLAMC